MATLGTFEEIAGDSTSEFQSTNIFDKCLSKNSEDRPSSPITCLGVLWRLYENSISFLRYIVKWPGSKQPQTNFQATGSGERAAAGTTDTLPANEDLGIPCNGHNGYLSYNGNIFGKIERLGRGRFGDAWLIESRSNGEKLVCKEIPISGNRHSREFSLKSFRQECLLLKIANHANIVRLISFEDPHPSDKTARVYMEYCDGGDLSAFINDAREGKRTLTQEIGWKIISQLAAALAYLHHGLTIDKANCINVERSWRAILHRDIKPNNVILSWRSGGEICVKLCDFGIGKLYVPGIDGTYIGTPRFKAPEITRDDPNWSFKADIYSLGRTIEELSKGFGFQAIDEIVRKCLSEAPENRPSSLTILEIAERQLNANANTQAVANIANNPRNVNGWEDRTFSIIVHVGSIEAPEGKDQDKPLERLRLLTRDGCDLNVTNGATGNTPLHEAAETGNYLLAQRLLLLGANVNAISRSNQTALSLAVERGDEGLVELFQGIGAVI